MAKQPRPAPRKPRKRPNVRVQRSAAKRGGKRPAQVQDGLPKRAAGHKMSQPDASFVESDGTDSPAGFRPKPVHFRLLEAYEVAFQNGTNPTDAVIAHALKVSRETITRWRRRNTELRRWIYENIGTRAEELRPLVDRRVTQLALSGSVEHAKLFYQFVAKAGNPDRQEGTVINTGVTLNLLVPRPDAQLQLTHGLVVTPDVSPPVVTVAVPKVSLR